MIEWFKKVFSNKLIWQPIETAPKDGTWIITGRKDHIHPIVSKWNGLSFGVTDSSMAQPTHWMPFPALPDQPNPKGNQ